MMPSEGTERQGFRYPRRKWRRFGATAEKNGTNASALIQEFIDWYLSEPKCKAPKKPKEQLTPDEVAALEQE